MVSPRSLILLVVASALFSAAAVAGGGPSDDPAPAVKPKTLKKTPPPVVCGDKVALRTETSFKFVTVSKDLSAKATSSIPGIGELFVLECKSKDAGMVVELGDSISLRSLRSGKYLNDGSSDHVAVSADPRNARGFFLFVVLDPIDVQARGPLLRETPFSLRSLRANLMTYLAVHNPKTGVIMADSDNNEGATADKFRFYVFPQNTDGYKAACPADKNGRTCSGNGICIDRHCDCNDDAVGERCELLREEAECSAVGDVHIESFDGGLYNVYELGEFLFYEEEGSKYREAVAGFVSPWQKYNGTAVLTSVTMRRNGAAGEDFVTFNNYGTEVNFNCDRSKDYGPEIKRNGKVGVSFRNGLRVTWANSMWEVNSPSRMRLRVKPRTHLKLIDIFIGVDTPRMGTARGLCGDNNQDPENDLTPRMKTRFRNEPAMKLLNKLRIDDGRVYPTVGTLADRTNGYDSGTRSKAFYACKAKAEYVPADATTALLGLSGGIINVPEEQRNQVRTSVETALSSGYCTGSPRMQDSAAACCRTVLIRARALSGTQAAPLAQLKLDMDINDHTLQKAWSMFKGVTVPSASVVKGDYIDCLTDICKTRVSKFCQEEKEDVELQRGIRADDNAQLARDNKIAKKQMQAEQR